MTDRELLELAAKAEGRTIRYMTLHLKGRDPEEFIACWNPLTDDGDALRLAVRLKMDICWNENEGPWEVNVWPRKGMGSNEDPSTDPYAATRRAIVRAAAEIGKAMP